MVSMWIIPMNTLIHVKMQGQEGRQGAVLPPIDE